MIVFSCPKHIAPELSQFILTKQGLEHKPLFEKSGYVPAAGGRAAIASLLSPGCDAVLGEVLLRERFLEIFFLSQPETGQFAVLIYLTTALPSFGFGAEVQMKRTIDSFDYVQKSNLFWRPSQSVATRNALIRDQNPGPGEVLEYLG